ncbi:MAG: hypothetical protein J6S23_03660 [Clostridia bacterium]|nr:hypothetical protein [Clostridia bacterium]
MYKLQMKLQKIITLFCLAAAALTFIYSLGVSTDAYFLRSVKSLGKEVPGSEMYVEMQPFNKDFTTFSIVLILLAVACLVFNNHTRRKYYFANYCTTILSSVANIGVAIWAFINVFDYKAKFLAVDYSNLSSVPDKVLQNAGIDPENVMGPYSTFWFDASIVVLSILIIVSLLNIANMIFKTMLMKEEKRVLKNGGML